MKATSGRIEDFDVSVLLDIRYPFSYLALGPTIELARESGASFNWLPISVPPLKEPSRPGPNDDRGLWHRRHRARALAREIDVYADAAGLLLREPYRAPETLAFEACWLWLRSAHVERLTDFLVETFRAYWALELDISDVEALASLLQKMDLDGRAFAAWSKLEGKSAVVELGEELGALGVPGSPCFRVGEEVFLGRQHLPMIRWLLGGRSGPGPI